MSRRTILLSSIAVLLVSMTISLWHASLRYATLWILLWVFFFLLLTTIVSYVRKRI